MAITFTHRLQGADSTNTAASHTTGTVTPATDGSPIALWMLNTRSTGTVSAISTIVGLGLTWTLVSSGTTRDFGGGAGLRLILWKGVGTASTGTVVITPTSSTNATGMMWAFVQMAGADPLLPFGPQTNKIESTVTAAATSASLTLPSSPAAGSAVLGAVGHAAAEDITAGTNFTRGTNQANMASPSMGLNYEYKTASVNTTVDASWATSSVYSAWGFEVYAAAGDSVGFIPI